ncbi:agenet and bromo-adjacent homology (BAH) domain-containing protein [Actinidia rufa]|uniref:Agenet and bromo-adjacent homology (BAH) domain-containing protein n=1 Tax=Actinidia rufa TaxID=165716 RepID=A0A7J0FZL3_9ERIC|nr:agenet and bromo-adjacent homology (BAH) domain-containing protein [Actinidia rufa]
MAGISALQTHVTDFMVPRRLKVQNSDIVWSGVSLGSAVHSFVFIMAEEESHYVGYLEDLYEDKKGQKKVKVRWFHHSREINGVIPQLNPHPREVFITSHVQVISAECIDGPATVLTPKHYEKCEAIVSHTSSAGIHMCFRQFVNNKVKPFSLSKLQGYLNQAILSSLDCLIISKQRTKGHKSNGEDDDDYFAHDGHAGRGAKRNRSCGENDAGSCGAMKAISGNQITQSEPTCKKLRIKLSRREPSSIKLVGPEALSHASFKVDEKIELLCQDSGIRGCWFRCKVLQTSPKRLKVQYVDVQNTVESGNLEICDRQRASERGMGGGASSKLRRAARKIVQTCGSFSRGQSPVPVSDHHTSTTTSTMSPGQPRISATPGEAAYATQPLSSTSTPKNLCAICLDPLSYGTGPSPAQAVFTAQCSHAFHFACISCNVRHGSVTCPICRAHWTQLPRNLNPSCSPLLQQKLTQFSKFLMTPLPLSGSTDDPSYALPATMMMTLLNPTPHLLIIVSISISYLSPLTPPSCHPCSNQSLQVTHLNSCHSYGLLSLNHLRTSSSLLAASPGGQHFAPTGKTPSLCTSSSRAYLSVTLARQPATDLWFFSLRPIDRLAIVTYSSAAARVFPLKRMTSYGKRTALQVIDRIFYMGQADPIEGLKKGVKILGDCTHKNPRSSILHLSDSPTRSYHRIDIENSIPIHRFHVGFDFGTSSGFVMHEFEEFLTRALGDVIKEIQLRIGENARILRLGELRGGEERKNSINFGTGEILAGTRDERERVDDGTEALVSIAGRNSSVESWDYHDPYRARRWAKHLHGYRI